MLKGVTKEQKLLLLSTFVVGLVCGAYLYLTVYAPKFKEGFFPDLPVTVRDGDVSIRAAQYGDCISSGLTCPSYELDVEGTLFTTPPTPPQNEAVIYELPQKTDTLDALYAAITAAPISEYSVPSANETCTHTEGDNYRYVLFLGKENFILDTCRTNFPKESELAAALLSFFETQPVLE